MEFLAGSLLELVVQTSTNLPPDVRQAMSIAANTETPGTQSSQALDIILGIIDMAHDDEGPIWQAQGQGCAPGAVGVCIGSDRAHGYELAKHQLFRTLDDVNPVPELATLEAAIMEEANRIGVGAMGFGGKASLIGCKIMAANRLPASFFVSVAYDCWAYRRLGVRLDAVNGAITGWLYRDPARPVEKMTSSEEFPLTGREVVLRSPLSEETIRALKVGDTVLISGEVYTGRDAVHAHLMKHPPPVDLHGAVLYHCGPVMLQHDGAWTVKAAGPT